LSPGQARTVLVIFALGLAFFVAVALGSQRDWNGESHAGPNDIDLYRAVVERVHAGERYHDANFAERIARGYPTQSVFNCRMPVPFWVLGYLPHHGLGKLLAVLLALVAAGVLFRALLADDAQHPGVAFLGLLLLSGPLMLCALGEIYLMPVLWSGLLIALSLGLYGLNRPYLAVAAGVLALLVRELALPYCALCALMAWRQPRPREVLLWGAGVALWLAFFAWHWHEVMQRIPPEATAHAGGWVQWGGAGFVLSAVRMNAYLLVSPPWVAALFLAVVLLGLAGWSSPWGTRVGLTVSLYVAAFAVVGLPVNAYWGLMIAPLLALGAARWPAAIAACWRRAMSVGRSSVAAG
jgi:hypothetical protein